MIVENTEPRAVISEFSSLSQRHLKSPLSSLRIWKAEEWTGKKRADSDNLPQFSSYQCLKSCSCFHCRNAAKITTNVILLNAYKPSGQGRKGK